MEDKTTKRKWGATGVDWNASPFKLNKVTIEHISTHINTTSPNVIISEQFIADLEAAATNFKAQEKIAKQSSPGEVRKNLKRTMKSSINLMKKLNDLDGNSIRLINEVEKTNSESLNKSLSIIISTLSKARLLADEYQGSGSYTQHFRIYFAHDVAEAIKNHLGITPTQTKDGLFESILSIVLEAVSGKKVNSLHSLTKKGLGVIKTDTNGVIEYNYPDPT